MIHQPISQKQEDSIQNNKNRNKQTTEHKSSTSKQEATNKQTRRNFPLENIQDNPNRIRNPGSINLQMNPMITFKSYESEYLMGEHENEKYNHHGEGVF